MAVGSTIWRWAGRHRDGRSSRKPGLRWAAPLLIAAALAQPAQADDLPPGRLGVVVGVRSGAGALADAFGLGGVLGFEAGWEPMTTEQRLGWAARWSVMWSRFDLFGYGLDPASITGNLRLVELDAGLRARFAPRPGVGRLITVGFGATALRSNVPLPPRGERAYVGGYACGGLEYLLSPGRTISLEVRYGLIGDGPGSIDVLAGFALGI